MSLKLWLRWINIYSAWRLAELHKQTLNNILGRVLGRVAREGKAEPITFHTQITRLHAPEDRATLALTHALRRGGPISCPRRQNSVIVSQSHAVFQPDADQGKSIRSSALNGHSLWLKQLQKCLETKPLTTSADPIDFSCSSNCWIIAAGLLLQAERLLRTSGSQTNTHWCVCVCVCVCVCYELQRRWEGRTCVP